MNWIVLVVFVIALARITHLIADDAILERPRDWLVAKSPERLAPLWSCTWCVSVWVALAGWAVVMYEDWALALEGSYWSALALWPALSYLIVAQEALLEYLYGSDD